MNFGKEVTFGFSEDIILGDRHLENGKLVKECPHCGNEIDAQVQLCPFCHNDPNQPPAVPEGL